MKKYFAIIIMTALVFCLGPSLEANANTKVFTGGGSTFAVIDGKLMAWGLNNGSQLGLGDTVDRNAPTQVGTDSDWLTVSTGSAHTLAIKTDGTLWSWGANSYGQLGLVPDIGTTTIPTQVGTDSDWYMVNAEGYYSSFAIKTNGSLWAWGYSGGTNYQLGLPGNAYNIPTRVGTENNWASVAGGTWHTLAIKTNGTIWNFQGGISQVTQVGGGCVKAYAAAHPNNGNFVIKSDSTLWFWATNVPLYKINTPTFAKAVAYPYASTVPNSSTFITIRPDGTLWSWGYNNYGQLGLGDTTSRTAPVQVGTDTNWSDISGAPFTTYALRTDGTLWAAGQNNYGQLGNGTTIDSNVFVQVQFPVTQFTGTINLTCPANMFAGDTQNCTAEVPDQGTALNITWSITNTMGNPVSGDVVTPQGNVGEIYTAQIHPVTPITRRVVAQACFVSDSNICGTAEALVTVNPASITIGNLTGPSELEWTEHGTVEVPSVRPSFGTVTGAWSITGDGAQSQEATPSGTNISALEIWSTNSTGGTITATYTATSVEDSQLTASKNFTITVNPASITIGDLLGVPQLEINDHGIVEVPSVAISFGDYTGVWSATGAGARSQEATPTESNISALEVWGSEAGELLVSYTATSTLDADVSATKYFVVVIKETTGGGGDPGVSDVMVNCPEEVIAGQNFLCTATVNISPEYARTYRWSYGGGGGKISAGSNDEETNAAFISIGEKTINLAVTVTETGSVVIGTANISVVAKPVLSGITIERAKELALEGNGIEATETYTATAECPTGHTCEIVWNSGTDTGTGESFMKSFTLPGKYIVTATIKVTDVPPEMKIEKSSTISISTYLVTEPKLIVNGIPVMVRVGTEIIGEAYTTGRLTSVKTWTYPGGTSTGATLNWTPAEPGEFEITCSAYFEGHPDKVTQKVIPVTVVQMADIAELQIVRRPLRELYAPTSAILYPQVVINQEVPLIWERYVTKGASYNWTVNGVSERNSVMFRPMFNQEGEYVIGLEIILADGRTLSATKTLTVNPPLPITAMIRESIRRSTCLEEPRSGYFRGITRGGVVRSRITIAKWFLDDTEIESGSTLKRIFDEPGIHVLRWEVENNFGQAGVAQTEIEVIEETAPGIDFRSWKSNEYDRAPLRIVAKAYPSWGCNNKEKIVNYGWKVDGEEKPDAVGYC